MAALNNFIVVLGLCALFCNSFAYENCNTVLFGVQTFNQRSLTRGYFSFGTKLQEVNIHSDCDAVGVLVKACDDVAPNVYVQSTTEALVERLGSLTYPGYVDVVTYCPTMNEPLIVSPKPKLIESFIGSDEA